MRMTLTKNSEKLISYVSLASPALLVYLAVIAFPVISSIFLGFNEYNIYKNAVSWVGLAHYAEIFSDGVFFTALKNNFIIVFISVFIQIPLGFVLAYALYRKVVVLRGFFQAMVFLPITISTIVVGILWSKMFSPFGAVTGFLRFIYNDPNFILTISENKHLSMLPIVVVMVWMYTGFFMVIILANLQKIDPSLIEAASIDGANEFEILMKIIVPNMAGILVTLAIFSIAGSLKSFDLIYAMTEGGPAHYTEVLAIYMYNNTFGNISNYGYGSAVSTIIVVISIFLITFTRGISRQLVGKE